MPLNLQDTTDTIAHAPGGLVVPPHSQTGARGLPSGVLTSAGEFVEQSISWSNSTNPVNAAPVIPADATIVDLPGKHMFGGVFYGHFGHFVVESLSRIWALDAINGLDGIIFTPKGPRITDQHVKIYGDLMRSLGVNVPVRVAADITRVENLYVPRQGFGMNDLIDGSQAFRDFINRHAGKSVEPDGPEKLYVSRSALPPFRGSILGETRLEQYLIDEGYEVFHPQKAPHLKQVATYRAARTVLGTDCSPLHLLGYVGNSQQKVGILSRRSMEVGSYLVRQFQQFKGSDTTEFRHLVNDWMPQPGSRPSRTSWGEIDYPALHAALLQAGFIRNPTPWPNLTRAERDEELDRLKASHEVDFKPFRPDALAD